MTSRLAMLLVPALLATVGCATDESSRNPVGVYDLVAYRWDNVDLALPYRQELSMAGDSEMWDAATLTLEQDSTWRALWHHAIRLGGTWQPFHTDTLHGVFTAIPAPTGWEIALGLTTFPYADQGGPAFINGRDLLLYNSWVYRRE